MLQSWIAVFNDVKVWNNEVRVRSSNPCGLFLMALNAPFSSVFLNLKPLVCHNVLGFSIGLSERCVFELANQSREAGAKTEHHCRWKWEDLTWLKQKCLQTEQCFKALFTLCLIISQIFFLTLKSVSQRL